MSRVGFFTIQNEWKTWRIVALQHGLCLCGSLRNSEGLNKNEHLIWNLPVAQFSKFIWHIELKRYLAYFVNIDTQTQESLVTLRYICHIVSLVSYWKIFDELKYQYLVSTLIEKNQKNLTGNCLVPYYHWQPRWKS